MHQRSPLRKLLDLILLDRQDVVSIYFYAILSGLVQLSLPVGVQAIIGFVLGATMVTSIYVLIFLVVLGVLMVGLMRINQMRIIEKVQQKIFTRNAFAFAEKIPNLDLQAMDKYYLPEKVNYFFDTLNVQKGLSKILLNIPTASIQILFGLLLLSLYHPFFIAFGIVLVAILFTILKLTSTKGLASSLEESSHKYAVVAWLEEMAKVIKSFKFSQGTHFNLQKTDESLVRYIEARTTHFKVLLFQYKTLVFFKVAITAAMLVVGTTLLLRQQLNIGEFIAAEIVVLSVINAVEKLIINLDSAYDVLTGLEKISTITESPVEKDGTALLNVTQGIEIQLSNVNFYYNEMVPVLSSINLTIPPASLVGITGEEESGKSSFLKLLSGSYRAFEGSILYNLIPVLNYSLESLRGSTGIMLNQQEVFAGTVMENITLGKSTITAEHIMNLSKELGIEQFITSLPQGFETIIDTAGKKLASTFVKKILLLRALAHDPRLLLLEEPWMGLEESTRYLIIKYLIKKSANSTVIVVSNEQSFLQHCTFIIEMKDGNARIKE